MLKQLYGYIKHICTVVVTRRKNFTVVKLQLGEVVLCGMDLQDWHSPGQMIPLSLFTTLRIITNMKTSR
jgi:hypothetical protein